MMVRPIARGMGSTPVVHADVPNRAPGSVISQQLATVVRRIAGPAILLAPTVVEAAPSADAQETLPCGFLLIAAGFGALCGGLIAVSARLRNFPGAVAGFIGGACGIATFVCAAGDMHHELARWSGNIAVLAAAASAATNLRRVR